MECATCGGTDFTKESGYYYCSECQTQSQEVRDHVFQEENTNVNVKGSKRIKTSKTDKTESDITSWECYNVVMASLTQQLINLGADKSLRPVVKTLWMRYLEKLEVINLNCDEKPKLSLVNSKRDFGILYGEKKKRKRKKSLSDESSITNSASIKRRITKKKRELAEAQYIEFSQKSTQESGSLHTETLASVKSSSDRTDVNSNVKFSRYSIAELRKKNSKYHIKKHKEDKSRNLKCHKFTYQSCSKNYKTGIHFVSPVKLYCILYLGLLIIKDRIQLGDLFRFIREGHLSFNHFTHLFPETYTDKFLNIRNNTNNSLFSNKYFRVTTAKLADFLKVTSDISVPDLLELSKRYCQEMNLPGEFLLAVTNILSKTNVKLRMTKVGKIIPNYEGRVMSIILFTLKLLFGLDGKTENHLSKYAQLINELHLTGSSMFDFEKWMVYIEYRNLILSEYHFPTHDISNSKVDSDLYLQYVKSHNIEFDENFKLTREMKHFKELLTRIKSLQNDFTTHIEFPASLTPFRSHTEVVLQWIKTAKSEEILKHSFEGESLDFLLRPNEYLLTLNSSVIVKHHCANNNWVMGEIRTKRTVKNISRKHRNVIPVRLVTSIEDEDMYGPVEVEETSGKKPDPHYVQEQYQKCRKHLFEKNARYVKRFSKSMELNLGDMDQNVSYTTHYNPYERYWLYLQMNLDLINKDEFDEFFQKNNSNFQVVFKECSRIIEQNILEFYTEFQFTELYLVFAANFCDEKYIPKPKRWLTEKLGYYVDQAEDLW